MTMDDREHSQLIYLLDAIRAAPHKLAKFIAITNCEGTSDSFKRALDELSTTDNIVATSQRLRNSLL